MSEKEKLEEELSALTKEHEQFQENWIKENEQYHAKASELKKKIFEIDFRDVDFSIGKYFLKVSSGGFHHDDLICLYRVDQEFTYKVEATLMTLRIDDGDLRVIFEKTSLIKKTVKKEGIKPVPDEIALGLKDACMQLDLKIVNDYLQIKNLLI